MHIPLKSLKFLALDCQTTGNSPKSSHLLEIGWLEYDALHSPALLPIAATTFVTRQPRQEKLSKRIQRLTGIDDCEMEAAVEPRTALDALLEKAAVVARSNQTSHCPVVIHYARFEMAFLASLHEKTHPGMSLPFNVICTHQIASRLLPELPRKGIRAVAGYLGHSVPVTKRCAHHLLATVHIWHHLVARLAEVADVQTLDQLERWLKEVPVSTAAKSYPMPREKRLDLPESPGIYRMLRSNGDVLYVGKATSLKQRINSYFQKRRHSESTLEMLTQAVGLDTTTTRTALEAALCESDAIKTLDPPYNSALVGRHRRLHFISRDFGFLSDTTTKTCPLGPVPSADPFVACHRIGSVLGEQARTSLDIPLMMAMPAAFAPDGETFSSGLALFREKNGPVLNRMRFAQAILHIGHRSWLEKLALKAAETETEPESGFTEEPSEFVWTPDAVASNIEAICRRCGFMLRRARWFAMLSESTVAWRVGPDAPTGLNVIVLHNGDVEQHDRIEMGTRIPRPPGSNRRQDERRGRIDLLRYDRLRVLTTEMRRLLSEDRLECVRLGNNVRLYPDQIRRIFNWV